ncbi:MAG: glycosyltransferase [Ferruginibacter sp.]
MNKVDQNDSSINGMLAVNKQTASPYVSVVMPCLNEEAAIGACIKKIQRVFINSNIDGEIVVCDNGSTDRSVEIAESLSARVVHQPVKGYGSAYLMGFSCAKGKYLVMGDADDTYDFNLIPDFLDKLDKEGNEFVTGSRYLGKGDKAITFLHRYFGNPALTAILNVFFGTKYTDVYCGFRAFSKETYELIQPVSTGMEFNLELAINAKMANLKIAEIPIQLGERKGASKLRTFRDGWRSLRMMLLYCPNKAFLFPGVFLSALGLLIHLFTLTGLLTYDGREFSTVTGIFALIFSVVGFQILSLGIHVKTYSWSRRFDKSNESLVKFYQHFNLEKGILLGLGFFLTGFLILLYLVIIWFQNNLLPLPNPEWAAFAATLFIIGLSTIFTSLFVSAMSIKPKS